MLPLPASTTCTEEPTMKKYLLIAAVALVAVAVANRVPVTRQLLQG